MARRSRPGLFLRENTSGGKYWHIDKGIQGQRLRESTFCSEAESEAAQAFYDRRVSEIRDAVRFGTRPRRTFREAAAKYLTDYAKRRGIARDADALADLDSFIGECWIDEMHNGTFDPYRTARKAEGRSGRPLAVGTINRNISVAANILSLCARLWRHQNGMAWLETAPMILLPRDRKKRKAYPLDWDEQRLFFSELVVHLQVMAMFKANAGPRSKEICRLEWVWERRIEIAGVVRSVFLLPGDVTKNGEPRVLVLNDVAQSIVDQVRGQDPVNVFTYQKGGRRRPLKRMRCSGWRNARRRAVARYEKELGRVCPDGFKRLRVHDLRHTYGRRLRAAGVSREDRRDLLGHKSRSVTTDYSAPEIGNLVRAANLVTKSRKIPATTLLKVV